MALIGLNQLDLPIDGAATATAAAKAVAVAAAVTSSVEQEPSDEGIIFMNDARTSANKINSTISQDQRFVNYNLVFDYEAVSSLEKEDILCVAEIFDIYG